MQRLYDVHCQNSGSFRDSQGFEVFHNHAGCFGRLIHEVDMRSASAEGFDSAASYSATSVQKCRSLHSCAQDIEQRFPELVAGWTNSGRWGALQTTAFETSGDNSHSSNLATLTRPFG